MLQARHQLPRHQLLPRADVVVVTLETKELSVIAMPVAKATVASQLTTELAQTVHHALKVPTRVADVDAVAVVAVEVAMTVTAALVSPTPTSKLLKVGAPPRVVLNSMTSKLVRPLLRPSSKKHLPATVRLLQSALMP